MHDNNLWQYCGKLFTSTDAEEKISDGFLGFIYKITDISSGRKYIGKKLLVQKIKLAPLKGSKRKRTKIRQSDWEKYYGSSEMVKELVAIRPHDFTREILSFCRSKGELNYAESALQFELGVLLSDDYFNGIINCRINKSHVKSLWKS